MSKGILLIAAGHAYYGRMAAALIASIRVNDPEIVVHLCWSDNALNHLTDAEKAMFTSMSEIPDSCFGENKKLIRAKLCMYDLSPFDETLYLDCDLAWLKRPASQMFDLFQKCNVSFNLYSFDETIWANMDDVRKAYGNGNYWNVQSELIYFKKKKSAKKWFDASLAVFDDLKIKHTLWADGIPDELALSIGAKLTKTNPVLFPHPFFNPGMLEQHIYQIAEKYFAISMAGNRNSNFGMQTYNTIISAAYRKLGLQNPYTWKPKRSFLPERKNL